jgi:hypothetical protein
MNPINNSAKNTERRADLKIPFASFGETALVWEGTRLLRFAFRRRGFGRATRTAGDACFIFLPQRER